MLDALEVCASSATRMVESQKCPSAQLETLTRADLPNLPKVYRLVSLERTPLSECECKMIAVVFHEQATLRVTWSARHTDSRLKLGQLVRIAWSGGAPTSFDGAIAVSRVIPLEHHVHDIDLFQTVPMEWVKDREVLKRASTLWNNLLLSCQELITAIFWDAERFERFCRGPSSCRGHHAERGGNLRHAVETAEAVKALLPSHSTANASLAITAALLHDAGKVDDYVMRPGEPTRLSDWGLLVSHRQTLTFWLGEAHQKLRYGLSRKMLQSLLHTINAQKAPKEFGLRDAVTPEANLLKLADNASGQGDLISRQSSSEGGWGCKHNHLGNLAPYTLGVDRPFARAER